VKPFAAFAALLLLAACGAGRGGGETCGDACPVDAAAGGSTLVDSGTGPAADLPAQDMASTDPLARDSGSDVSSADLPPPGDPAEDLPEQTDFDDKPPEQLCDPPDPEPNLSPSSGYPMDGWAWSDRRHLLDPPAGAAYGQGWLDPAPVEVGGVTYVYLTLKQAAGLELWRGVLGAASIEDLEPLEGAGGGYASVLHEDGVFRLWYGGGVIRLAESRDGVSFVDVPDSELRPTHEATFDSISVLYPAVVRIPEGYALWYTGYDEQRMAIGRALSPDGKSWTRSPAEPVIVPGPASAFDNKSVAQPHVLAGEAGFLMWYGGYDTSRTNPGPYRVGLARSADGVAWETLGVTLELAVTGTEAYSTRDPAVVGRSGAWSMLYTAMGDDGLYRVYRARSVTCWE